MTVVGKFQADVVRAVSSFERTSVPDPVLIRSSVVAVHFSQNILYWVGNFHGEVSPPLQHPEIVDGHDLLFSFRLSTSLLGSGSNKNFTNIWIYNVKYFLFSIRSRVFTLKNLTVKKNFLMDFSGNEQTLGSFMKENFVSHSTT